MAIYHLSAKIISRKTGRSATASAAYRAGVEIADERTGEVHDYTRKRGVESSEILLPDDAPEWAADRAALWNAVEAKNKRKDAQVAREIIVALPDELSAQDRGMLARRFAREIAQTYQVGVDLAIHKPSGKGDDRNHHAHLLLTTNRLGPDGLGNKAREFDGIAAARSDDRAKGNAVDHLRERWATLTNDALERAGRAERVDHRSLKAQGIEREPTKHLGPAATAIERATQAPSRLREDRQAAAAFKQARAEELDTEVKAIRAELADLLQHRADLERQQVGRETRQQEIREQVAAIGARLDQAKTPEAPAIEQPAPAEPTAAPAVEAPAQLPGRGRRQDFGQVPTPAAHQEPAPAVLKSAPPESLRGDLVAFGRAPYLNKPENAQSYYVSVLAADGKMYTHWGVGLEGAMERAGATYFDAVELRQTGRVPAAVRDKDGNERTVQRIVWDVEIQRPTVPEQPKAPDRDPEQVYADLLKPILERHQAAAQATQTAVCDERDRYREASRAHYHREPTGMFAKAWSKAKWDREGDALAAQGEPLREREEAARKGVQADVILKAAREELRSARPGVVEAADAAERERIEQAKKKLKAQAEKADRDKAAKDLARDKANVGKDFKSLAVGRESRAHGYTDHADKWRYMAPELKEKVEAYIKMPTEQRPAELKRIHADPLVFKLLQEHRAQGRTQGRGGYGD